MMLVKTGKINFLACVKQEFRYDWVKLKKLIVYETICLSPKMETPIADTIEKPTVPVSTKINAPYSRTAWWREHKDEPRIIECMREARRKYYYKNQEKEKQRAREYYHKKKALLAAQVQKEGQYSLMKQLFGLE